MCASSAAGASCEPGAGAGGSARLTPVAHVSANAESAAKLFSLQLRSAIVTPSQCQARSAPSHKMRLDTSSICHRSLRGGREIAARLPGPESSRLRHRPIACSPPRCSQPPHTNREIYLEVPRGRTPRRRRRGRSWCDGSVRGDHHELHVQRSHERQLPRRGFPVEGTPTGCHILFTCRSLRSNSFCHFSRRTRRLVQCRQWRVHRT